MIEWFISRPIATGVVTFLLMWSDWLLTILQERERQLHYFEHYESYPINTIEGHPAFQSAVKAKHVIEARHIIPAFILSTFVAFALAWAPPIMHEAMIGYVWGLFMIVDTTHIGNLIGYRAGRRGLHGKLFLHQRTAYLMQMGRYMALAFFLMLLAACSASLFIVGCAVAGISSAVRQLVFLRRVPRIDVMDAPPTNFDVVTAQ